MTDWCSWRCRSCGTAAAACPRWACLRGTILQALTPQHATHFDVAAGNGNEPSRALDKIDREASQISERKLRH